MATVAVKVGGLLCSLKPGWGTEQVAAQVSSLGHPREELSSEGRGVRQTGGLGELGSDPGRRTSPEASQRDPASRRLVYEDTEPRLLGEEGEVGGPRKQGPSAGFAPRSGEGHSEK